MKRTFGRYIGPDPISGKKRRRERVEKKAGTCAHVKKIELKRKKEKISGRCNGTHAREKQMKFGKKDGHGKEKKRKDRPEQNQSTKIQLDYSVLKLCESMNKNDREVIAEEMKDMRNNVIYNWELHRKDVGKVFEACSHSLGNTCIS
ncbi:LOW QUALITY PROTEIN: hypothetical protein V1477_011776 [Vespula maculifrons]|uniref:Uncharacterized protein n=1 Tax=Vespula maculifrons TaxID=7453 RepID=A0ABD2C053_VESMC